MTESPPPFTPVPTRARHDGWTPERQRRFVAALAATGVVAAAAHRVGMSPRSAYALRRRAGDGSEFARAWDAALAAVAQQANDAALTHALDGELVPVFYRGRRVGQYRRFNGRVVLAALRAADARAPGRDRPSDAPSVDSAERLAASLARLAAPS